MKNTDKIFLVGFMGCGKSTLGKKLAKQLNLLFYDLDNLIEEKENSSIENIFKEKGENHFRKLEHDMLKDLLLSDKRIVIALGGGTPCFYNNMDLINQHGISIYIKYNAGILSSRLINAKNIRPLIKGKTKEELTLYIENLLTERNVFYDESSHIIEKNNIKLDDLLSVL